MKSSDWNRKLNAEDKKVLKSDGWKVVSVDPLTIYHAETESTASKGAAIYVVILLHILNDHKIEDVW